MPNRPIRPRQPDGALNALTSRFKRAGGIVVIFTATLIAYAPALRAGFVWDDDFYLTDNHVIRNPDGLKRTWIEPTSNPQYYPLVFTSFWLEYRLWKLHPAGYHAVNILLHAGCACLLWVILRRLAVPGAWVAGLIFALHPVQVESVAWVTERKNVLSGVFFFLALLAYLRFDPLDRPERPPPPRRWAFYFASLLLFAAALLSKSVTCSLPAMILVLLWWKRDRLRPADLLPLLPMFALGIAMAYLTVWVEKNHVQTRELKLGLTPLGRSLLAGRATWFYLGKLLIPVNLTFSYEKWTINPARWPQYIPPLALLVVLGILWRARHRIGKAPCAAALLYIGMLVPALGFIDVYPFRYSWVADHFQYLAAAVPIAGGVALICCVGTSHPARTRAISLLLALACAVLTFRQTLAYRDAETLWRDTIDKNPDSWLAKNNLGTILSGRNQDDKARWYFEEARRINPNSASALSNLACLELKRANWTRAIELCEQALRTDDVELAETYQNLGQALVQTGQIPRAVECYRRAIDRDPNYVLPRLSLCDLMLLHNQTADAEVQLLEIIRLEPEDAEPRAMLAKLYADRGDHAAALPLFLEAARLHPRDPALLTALARTHAALGRRADAIACARQAAAIDSNNAETRALLDALLNPSPP